MNKIEDKPKTRRCRVCKVTKKYDHFNFTNDRLCKWQLGHICRKCKNLNLVNLRREYRIDLIKFMGGKCEHCGITDFRVIQIDHKNADAKQDNVYKQCKSHSFFKGLLLGWHKVDSYQLLCANCNVLKRFKNKESRTKKTKYIRYQRKY